jgi:hypothetical protein
VDAERWLVCCNPERMLGCFEHQTSDRKLRLLACRWVRLLWDVLTPCGRQALEVAERCADDEATLDELKRARRRVTEVNRRSPAKAAAAWALFFAASNIRTDLADCLSCTRTAAERRGMLGETDLTVCRILRDVVGNPFASPVEAPTRPKWKGDSVIRLARIAYTSRLLPAGTLDDSCIKDLADVLEESGCSDPGFLDHLRQCGEHVRGCWLLDRLLEKV